MAGTILSYLKEYGDRDLQDMPLNEVDSLILCQLAYLKFDDLVPNIDQEAKPVSLRELAVQDKKDGLFADERYEKVNRELFEGMLRGKRFGNLRLCAYVNLIEESWELQFSAITIFLENGSLFIAFRGTDENLVGWKEDCNMAFLEQIPAQHCARKYFLQVAERFSGELYLGGHSKGGNLAIFAGMNCSLAVQKRILRIYNMDGPGFRPEVLKKYAYDRIRDRIFKFLPRSSIIGMLFERDTNYIVVESKEIGLLQHDPFTWVVERDQFVRADGVYEGRLFLDETINEWMASLTGEEIKKFVDVFFRILEASHAKNLIELGNDKKKSVTAITEAIKDMDPETAEMMKRIIRNLLEIAGTKALKEMEAWFAPDK